MKQEKIIFTDLAKELYPDIRPANTKTVSAFGTSITIEEYKTGEGRYVSLESEKNISQLCIKSGFALSGLIAHELKSFVPCGISKVLAVGLGNREMSVDAIGVKTADMIIPHDNNGSSLYVFVPGVEGSTGIPTAEAITAIASAVKAELLIAIDSLAAKSVSSLGRTVQITDRGIVPGGGLGRRNARIDRALMGIPVISIGVPTVISIRKLSSGNISSESDLYVAPSDGDALSKAACGIIASSIEKVCSAL